MLTLPGLVMNYVTNQWNRENFQAFLLPREGLLYSIEDTRLFSVHLFVMLGLIPLNLKIVFSNYKLFENQKEKNYMIFCSVLVFL